MGGSPRGKSPIGIALFLPRSRFRGTPGFTAIEIRIAIRENWPVLILIVLVILLFPVLFPEG